MPFSLYDAVIPTYLQVLPALAGMIDKAEAHGAAQGLAPAELLDASLAPDMWNFAKQVSVVGMHSARAVEAALAGEFVPQFGAPPSDFAGLKAILEEALAYLKTVSPEAIEAIADKPMVLRFGTREMHFVGADFLTSFALPNFCFHATAAYSILRMKGVPIGKMDFLGAVRMAAPAA
jgi:hypothetical protein